MRRAYVPLVVVLADVVEQGNEAEELVGPEVEDVHGHRGQEEERDVHATRDDRFGHLF